MTASYLDRTPSRALPWKRATLLAFTLGAQLFSANDAAAQQACGETTCAKGFTCETGMGGACPAIDCADPKDCPPCEPREYHVCVPATCSSASDCGPEQVCAERVVYDCAPTATPTCPPGEECAKAEFVAPECTGSTVSYCTLRWELPCTVAADCGAGFECVPQESCSSSGSPGTGAGTPGSAPQPDPALPPDREERPALPPPAEPICTPTGKSACVPIVAACQSDSDCLSGWTCQANPNGVCWSGPDGQGCAPADPAKLCVPPYYGTRGGSPEDGPTYGDGRDEPSTPGVTPVPENPQATPGTAPPSGENDAADDLAHADGGCSVTAAPSAIAGWGWLALGLAGALRLRRRR